MNFIAVYIGHRCTLWFYTFTLNKYFSHSESVSPKEFGHELVYSLFLFYLSFYLWTPVSGRHLLPYSWPSSMVHCLLPGARLLQESGTSWSSLSSFSLRQPYAPVPQGWTFLAFLPCSPRQPNSVCTCAKFGQDTAFCLSPGGSRALLSLVQALESQRFLCPQSSRPLPGCRGRWSLPLPFPQEPSEKEGLLTFP